jgi:hypothetical protein
MELQGRGMGKGGTDKGERGDDERKGTNGNDSRDKRRPAVSLGGCVHHRTNGRGDMGCAHVWLEPHHQKKNIYAGVRSDANSF